MIPPGNRRDGTSGRWTYEPSPRGRADAQDPPGPDREGAHLALAAVAATVLLTASRAEATEYTLSFFTFDRSTKLLVGTYCTLGDVCNTVHLTATASTVFDAVVPPNPTQPTDPYYGLVTAWNTLIETVPPNPVQPGDPYYGMLVAFGVQGAGALATTTDGTTLDSFQPLVQ